MTAEATFWAVIPVKSWTNAKARLAPMLDAAQRAGLAEAMMQDVLEAVRAARSLAGILVVTAEPQIAARAGARGVETVLLDSDPGLVSAFDAGIDAAVARGAQGVVLLPADLPSASGGDIDALITAHDAAHDRPAVSLVRAVRDGGTNALALTPPDAIALQFGSASADKHVAAARARGITAREVELAAIAHDIDVPDDVAEFMKNHSETKTYDFLLANGITADTGVRARVEEAL